MSRVILATSSQNAMQLNREKEEEKEQVLKEKIYGPLPLTL
jgi:hypothetical protein